MLKYRKITDTNIIIGEIRARLEDNLGAGPVLLLLSGGSAIGLQVEILRSFKGRANLSISLNDERYGPIGHKDSNWAQLVTAGIEELGLACYPILSGKDLAGSTSDFNQFLAAARSKYSCIISILGMGNDGHTSGILPSSPAAYSTELAASYKAEDYQRITNTFNFLKLANEVFVYAMGEAKHHQIDKLDQDLAPSEQPIQIIKQLKAVTFYNDYKGD